MLAQPHGVLAGRQVAQPGVIEGLEEHGRRRRAVADIVLLAADHRPQQHSPHVLIPIGKLDDAPGDDPAVVDDFRWLLRPVVNGFDGYHTPNRA